MWESVSRAESSGSASEHLELLTEWDYDRNEIEPSECTCFSSHKAWWNCKKGHHWKTTISDRSKGTGCPKCPEECRVSFPEKTILY